MLWQRLTHLFLNSLHDVLCALETLDLALKYFLGEQLFSLLAVARLWNNSTVLDTISQVLLDLSYVTSKYSFDGVQR